MTLLAAALVELEIDMMLWMSRDLTEFRLLMTLKRFVGEHRFATARLETARLPFPNRLSKDGTGLYSTFLRERLPRKTIAPFIDYRLQV